VEDRRLEWGVLGEGRFELMRADSSGILRSVVFPGLWLDEAAFWRDDTARVLAVLEQGRQSPEFSTCRAKHAPIPGKQSVRPSAPRNGNTKRRIDIP